MRFNNRLGTLPIVCAYPPANGLIPSGMSFAFTTPAKTTELLRAAMRVFEIDQDMDHFGVSEMQASFDDLAAGAEDVCLDLSHVRFLDSAGIGAMVSLHKSLRRRSLKLGIAHIKGQPQHLLKQVLREAYGEYELAVAVA